MSTATTVTCRSSARASLMVPSRRRAVPTIAAAAVWLESSASACDA
jgi:hypothetical protein